jgi:hypothetical protein
MRSERVLVSITAAAALCGLSNQFLRWRVVERGDIPITARDDLLHHRANLPSVVNRRNRAIDRLLLRLAAADKKRRAIRTVVNG